jgi:propanol-preferring alcohol dehydrogenase
MRAAVLEEFNKPYQLRRVETPRTPEGHDVLVRVLGASYCHTDAVFASGAMSQELPRVGCHEFAGHIVALGPQVSSEALQLAVGSMVGVPGCPYR